MEIEITEVIGFQITIRGTDYIFDNKESAKYFKWGFNCGLLGGEEKSRVAEYKKGYFQGVATRCRRT